MHVNWWTWENEIENALEFTGCDMEWFPDTRECECVPGRVAKSWAENLQEFMDTLRIATVHRGGQEAVFEGDIRVVVGEDFDEEATMALAADTMPLTGGNLTFRALEPLDRATRDRLSRFARFCRLSGGFRIC